MKIRLGNSKVYLDVGVEHPYLLCTSELDEDVKTQFQETIDERELCCDGCEKPLKNKEWISVVHRPKSSVDDETGEVRDVWALFFFCQDTQKDCCAKWVNKRPQ